MEHRDADTGLVHNVSSSGELMPVRNLGIHNQYRHLSDDALIAATRFVHARAHDAPKCIAGDKGGEHISGNAYARWADEWMCLAAECERRGLED